MKSKSTKIIASLLSICFVFAACFQLILGLKNLGQNKFKFMPVGSISTQYSSYGIAYDKSNFKLSATGKSTTSVAESVDDNTVLDYSTSLNGIKNSSINVKVHEKINSVGNLVDVITINGVIYGEITYNDNGLIYSNTLNYNDINYEYENKLLTNLAVNGLEYDYEYSNDKLSKIYLDDDIYSTFEYSDYNKINKEIYYYFDRMFEHTNVATIESSYNAETGSKIIAKIYDYVNDNPYQIVREDVAIEGQLYNVIKSVNYNGITTSFEYDYVYNGVPYITKVIKEDEEFYLSYINDKIISKTSENEIDTYVYSSSGDIVGSIVGKKVDGEFIYMFVAFVNDGFGNIIEANYLDILETNNQIKLDVKQLVQQRFDCLGDKIYKNKYYDIDLDFGFNSAFSFDELNLFYKNGNLYSSAIADYIFEPNAEKDFVVREFDCNLSNKKDNPTLSSVQKSVAIESLQNEINSTLKTSSLTGVKLVYGETNIASADVFTLPVAIDSDNMLKTPSKVAFVVNMDNAGEVAYYKQLIKKYYTAPSQVFAVLDDYYLSSPLEKELTYQFIYNHKLFTVKFIEAGLYGYSIKDNFSKKDYLKDTNIINYDTGRYVTYYNSTINTDNYISGISFLTNFSSTQEIDNFFEQLGFINTSIGETYQDYNFGDNAAFIKNVLRNTSNLNLPEYDKEKQYLTVDDYGNYVIKDIPENAKAEDNPVNANYAEIRSGVSKILSGIMFVVNGLFLVTACGPIAIICGVITLASGVVVTICGIAQVVEGYTGKSWIVENILGGKSELLDTIASVASTVATVASIVGSLTYKACFVEDTQIETINGSKNIQDVKVGDYVLSYNTQTGVQEYNKVLDTYSRKVDKLCEITVGGNTIVSSLNHPYYVQGKWVEASNLKVGDKVLLDNNKTVAVEDVKIIDSKNTTVYNMNVENAHTYYAEKVLVHNSCTAKDFVSKETDELFQSKEYTDTVNSFKQKYPNIDFSNKKVASKFWNSQRVNFNKSLGKTINESGNMSLKSMIRNLDKMAKSGNNPILKLSDGSIVKIQYHHFYGKLGGNMFNIYPMAQQKHMLFHDIFGRNDPNNWSLLAKYITKLKGL